jgi:hypothetical protein
MSLLKLWFIRNPVLVSYSKCMRQGSSNLSGSQSALTCLCVCARARLGLREFNTVYRVNDQSALETELNAMSGGRGQQRANTQQLQILRDENKTNILPHHNYFNELRDLFKEKFSTDSHEVTMGIDANESTTENAPPRPPLPPPRHERCWSPRRHSIRQPWSY